MIQEAFAPQLEMQIVDPAEDTTWDREIALHAQAGIFHTSAWAQVLSQTYGHKPFYVKFAKARETVAMLPLMEVTSRFTGRRGVSLPFSDTCDSLRSEFVEHSSFLDPLVRLGRARGWRHLELRENRFVGEQQPAVPSFYGHRLRLDRSHDCLMKGFASSVRRNIQKAERSGLTVGVAQTSEAVRQYYKLHERTRRRHGAPPQSAAFFAQIYERLFKHDLGFIVLAKKGERLLAGAVFFKFGKNALYKFGASDERLQEYRANNLVMWEGIRFLSETGSTTLHFGRTSPENAGLRRFKLAWGTTEETIHYSRYDFATETWAATQNASAGPAATLFAKLPLSVNRFIGTMVYPHLD